VTHGGQRVEIGENEYASVDMMIGPEEGLPHMWNGPTGKGLVEA